MARHFKQPEEQPVATPQEERAPEVPAPVPAAVPDSDADAAPALAPAAAPRKARAVAPAPAGGRRTKRGRSRGRHIVSNLLILAGVALLLVAGGMWGTAQLRYREQERINKKLSAYATVYDDAEEPRGPQVDWEGLKAVNPEVVGWLQIPGTEINYPVYQADNNDRYLRHNAEGEWTIGGQLFMDCDGTGPGMVDQSTLVYGHHLLDGTMFNHVAEMDQQEVFDATPTVWYVTEQASYECEPLMVYYVHADDTKVRNFRFESAGKFHEYLLERLAEAPTKRADAEQIIAGTDHVLCLITCNYYEEYESHGRTVVVCVPKTEAAAATGQLTV